MHTSLENPKFLLKRLRITVDYDSHPKGFINCDKKL